MSERIGTLPTGNPPMSLIIIPCAFHNRISGTANTSPLLALFVIFVNERSRLNAQQSQEQTFPLFFT
jgi:hypothetical protein